MVRSLYTPGVQRPRRIPNRNIGPAQHRATGHPRTRSDVPWICVGFSIDFQTIFDRSSLDLRQMLDRFSIRFQQILHRIPAELQ